MDQKCKERNEKIEKEKDLMVQMDPELAAILNKSTQVSGKWTV